MWLETERLSIVPVSNEDISYIHKLHCTKEIAEFNTLGIPMDRSVTEKLLEKVLADNNQEFAWTIKRKETNQLIGELGLGLSPEMDQGEIYYSLSPEAWGNAFAVEAVKKLIEFGFERLSLHKIEANTATKNLRSIKVLERVRMTKKSIQKKILLIGDDWFDNYTFVIVAPDSTF